MDDFLPKTKGGYVKTDSVLSFLDECHKEMKFSDYGFDFDKDSVYSTISSSTRDGGCLFVDECNGIIRGVFAAMLAPNIMDYRQKRAVEYIWHTNPCMEKTDRYKGMVKMLGYGIEWAKNNGIYITVGTSALKPAVKRILIGKGFTELDTNFGKGV